MKLVIAEKPSVAKSLAKVIGANECQDGYLEGSGYLVSWCIGHLVELSAPERYDERYAKWRLEDLPILPESFLYEVSPETKKQYQTQAQRLSGLIFFGSSVPFCAMILLSHQGSRSSYACSPYYFAKVQNSYHQ